MPLTEEDQKSQGTKRPHEDIQNGNGDSKDAAHEASDSEDDDDIGPALPSADEPKKKRRKLPFEKQYIAALPKSTRYSKSPPGKFQ